MVESPTNTRAFDIKDPGLAAEGRRRIDWASREMPVLRQIRDQFERERPLDGIRIVVCAHITTETGEPGTRPQGGWRQCRPLREQSAFDPGRRRGGARRGRHSRLCHQGRRQRDVLPAHPRGARPRPQIIVDDGADVVSH